MIVRVVATKWIVEATTSCAARACDSVSPTWAYSGSVKLPIGFTASAQRHRRAADRVGRRHEAVMNRWRDQQQATGDIAGGKNVRRGRSQVRIDAHEAPRIGLDPRRREVQPGRVRLPADGHDREGRLRAIAVAVVAVVHAHAAWGFLERFDLPEVLLHKDPRAAERGGDGCRNVIVFRRQDARAAVEKLHPRAEGAEDRSDLRPAAPPPITSIDAGTEVRPQASLCVLVNSNPGTSSRRLIPPVQRMTFSAHSRSPVVVSIVCGSTNRATPACSYTDTPSESICSRHVERARTSWTTSRTRASSLG